MVFLGKFFGNEHFDPVWVRITDPNGFGSVVSRVNAKPIRYSIGTDRFGSNLVSTGP